MDYKFRDGIQAIVYRNVGDKREFLIMRRIKNWIGWEFPKGGIKRNETHKQALMRELDPSGILNSGLDGKVMRAIVFHEGDEGPDPECREVQWLQARRQGTVTPA
jgi:hypothetical protein